MAKQHMTTLDQWAALQAAQFAQQCGLPLGNQWEPAIARHLTREVTSGKGRDEVAMLYRFQLGLCRLVRDKEQAVRNGSL